MIALPRYRVALVAGLAMALAAGYYTSLAGAPTPGRERDFRPHFTRAEAPPAPRARVTDTAPGLRFLDAAQALAAEPPQAIGPGGGQYVSADGLLKAVFPPGALRSETNMRLIRVDTAAVALAGAHFPSLAFAIDFAGARLEPGYTFALTAPVDVRLVDEGTALDLGFTPEKYHLRQNADEVWLMDVHVRGTVDRTGPLFYVVERTTPRCLPP